MVYNIISDLFAFFGNIGYLGILLVSFVGSIIVFVPVPYFPILIAAVFNIHLDPNLISLSSAVGITMAKVIIFYVSYYGNRILNSRTKERILPLQKLLSRYGWLGAFLAALTPIPDDLVYIPLGLAKYSALKFASAVILGKFLLNEVIVWGAVIIGKPFIEKIVLDTNNNTSPFHILIGLVISGVVLGIILYLTVKVDWAKIIGKWFPETIDKGSDPDSTSKPD